MTPSANAFAAYFPAALLVVLVLLLVKLPRETLAKVMHRPFVGASAVILTAALVVSAMAGFPYGDGTVLSTLLQNGWGLGRPEAGASAPMAAVSYSGEALEHVKLGASPAITIAKYTLIAAIAGGVTAFLAWICTALGGAYRFAAHFTDGVRMLAGGDERFPWRSAMVAGSILWILWTWIAALWAHGHPLGTDVAGRDVLYVLFEAVGGVGAWTALLILIPAINTLFMDRPSARWAGALLPAAVLSGLVLSPLQPRALHGGAGHDLHGKQRDPRVERGGSGGDSPRRLGRSRTGAPEFGRGATEEARREGRAGAFAAHLVSGRGGFLRI